MKIAILGLINYENYGDQFIGKTVEYIVKQYSNVETKLLDFSIDNGGKHFLILRDS